MRSTPSRSSERSHASRTCRGLPSIPRLLLDEPELGGQHDRLAAGLDRRADLHLRVTVDVCRVEEVDPEVQRSLDEADRRLDGSGRCWCRCLRCRRSWCRVRERTRPDLPVPICAVPSRSPERGTVGSITPATAPRNSIQLTWSGECTAPNRTADTPTSRPGRAPASCNPRAARDLSPGHATSTERPTSRRRGPLPGARADPHRWESALTACRARPALQRRPGQPRRLVPLLCGVSSGPSRLAWQSSPRMTSASSASRLTPATRLWPS